ncbi:EAL domain-containing protein [Delftia sp. HK171]|uniref:bifunctional diguanylate cyclase/phosphodiesterase n=1 Tax=Delftia sp. HK171 TaxID=1920191 RepID=UPI0011512DDC|nr:EAL domain-containing protein [Delftia sp. HK171]TQL81186.1 diguanylate cyclase (GGDEF)-like protein [Delftia sp. HK171]
MLAIYDCIVYEHDLRLVLLAAIICTISSFSAIHLLHHVGRSKGALKTVWLCVAGTATGFGIWATHFIAMLAYSPGIQSGYNIFLTLLSLLGAIVLTTVSFSVAATTNLKFGRWIGGGLVGGGIAVMHYTGMAAFEVPGHILWNAPLVALSIILGAMFGCVAIPVGLHNRKYRSIVVGALLLTLAICSHHFTAMTAAGLILDPSISVSPSAIPTYWLAIMVTVACCAIFMLTFAGFALDVRERWLAKRETERLNSMANAAFEGLLVHENNLITTVNSSFAELMGCTLDKLVRNDLADIIPDAIARRWLEERPCIAIETVLRPLNGGDPIEVEATSRQVIYAQKLQSVIAIRDLRDRKKAEQDIQYLAHHDTLTGLPNRNTFNKTLEQLVKEHESGGRFYGKYLAVLCLDLDRFKEVNDLFGHAAGDDLLRTVAICAQQTLRIGQVMARLGGDEFAIVAPGLSDIRQAERIAQGVLAAFAKENRAASLSSAMISSSIGIAIFPQDAVDGVSLMSSADTALYRAKADGRGGYRYFEAAMGEEARDRRQLEHELRCAILREELSLVYQPLVRTESREVIGFEALARWNHENRGMVPPSVFIPIAEECGLINQIGEWVLREACKEAASWDRPLSIAVNVSAAQLHNPYFVKIITEILNETKLAPRRLELEITETALVRDPARALITLRELKEIGLRIAMDDFGTGYSSLSNLRAFPFDKIKIDGSFIKSVHVNQQGAAIVRAVLGLGRGLELPVLAEGVETEDELEFLKLESCDEAQGYFLGVPQSIDKLMHFTHAAES